MHASVLGVLPFVAMDNTPDINTGSLQRYLAEVAWVPTALLPGHGVVWTAIDETRARAAITSAATTASIDFSFDEDGTIAIIFTDARPRAIGRRSVLTPWEWRFWRYEEHDGLKIPMEAEVAWLLPTGRQVYWRGEITDVHFEFEQSEGHGTVRPAA